MEFRLLGPVEVADRGRTLPLGGPKQRAVVAHLVLRANRVVPADRLIIDLWGDDPPRAARSTLRGYVSHLRKALGPDRLEGRSGGYVLRIDPAEVDAQRFEALVAEARRVRSTEPAAAAEAYRDALRLWRGPAMDDLADHASLQPDSARLEELRLAAVEERIGTELDLARHDAVVPELEALVGAHPLRERLWGFLMIALYRTGRQGDALEAYRRARELLAHELGIDPSSELQRLQEQVLRQDPALEIVGEPLRGYRLLEQVGAGAFGSVHRAFQPQVGREVAVKVIHPRLANDPEFIRRFEAEAQLVARLEHPHIVPLYDFWREPDGTYLVMRYLRGGSLRDRLAEGPVPPEKAASLLDQVAMALAAAHRQEVVHRDVRPANVLFDEEENAYLSDFGIAKDLAAAEARGAGGSPSPLTHYLSPEEIRGEEATPRTDIYGLGLVLYEALAGRHPFAESSPEEMIERHLREPVGRIDGLPPEVEEVIGRATAKDPAERYPDAPALANAFHTALLSPAARDAHALRTQVRNPYKGLRPFLEADAGDYFGRDALLARLLERMGEQGKGSRFLAVVGASGSGKSSVVRAALVPALRAGAVPGSKRWFVVEMHPGAHPFQELADALLRIAVDAPASLVSRLEGDGLSRFVSELPAPDAELLIVIDQFEEIFTLVEDEGLRLRFLDAIVTATTGPGSRVRVVAALRADFYDRPLIYPGFGDLLAARTEAVTPLSAEELERAVSGPATRVGVEVEAALVAEVVADVAAQPGALPLLQYALTELFEHRRDSTLTVAAYHEIGGVTGALARRADDLYSSLDEAGKDAARQLFLRLVTVGEDGSPDTRRRVLRTELTGLGGDTEAMDTVIDTFGARRLLSFDRDPETRGPTVELAHEALLEHWTRLKGWIDGAREDLLAGRRLAAAAHDWIRGGREPSFLLAGSRLERFETWMRRSALSITSEERDFVEASLSERDRRRSEEKARRARERALERRSVTRLRALVAVFAAAALVASGVTVFAFNQRSRAERGERFASARELAAAAVANLEVDPERSVLLALEAVNQTRSVDGSVLPEAEEALHRAVVASRVVLTVPGVGGALDWSPDGTVFVTEGPEESGIIDIRDAETGESLRSWQGHDVDVNHVVFSADGSMLATTGDDGTVRVWDLANGDRELWAFAEEGEAWGPSFSPDGSLLAATWPGDAIARVFDLATGEKVHELGPIEVLWQTSFSADGRRLAITSKSGAVVVDVGTGEEVFALQGHELSVEDVDWSPDGRWLATSANDTTIRIWDAETGDHRFTLFGHTDQLRAADWSPDSTRLVTGANDGTARVWEITEGGGRELFSFSGQDLAGGVWGVAFSPDGERVMAGDGLIQAVKVWDVSLTGDAEWATIPVPPLPFLGGGVAFTPDGRVATAEEGGWVTLRDSETGEESLTIVGEGPRSGSSGGVVRDIDVSPDGELIAAAGDDGTARVWEAATGEERFTHRHNGLVSAVAWSPDGTLLAVARDDGAVVLDRSGAEMSAMRENPGWMVSAATFSRDGRLLATTRWWWTARPDVTAMQVTVWDWARGEVTGRIRTHAFSVAFDPGGEEIAVAGLAGLVEIYDWETGERRATLAGHTADAFHVAYSPDGSRIGTASIDGTVRLWDAESGAQVLVLRGHGERVWRLAFSLDGSKAASIGFDETVRVWALDLDDLIRIANDKLTRTLTDGECRQYLHVERCPTARS